MSDTTWEIERTNEPHAIAVAGDCATVQSLADLLCLDATEAQAWLRPGEGTTIRTLTAGSIPVSELRLMDAICPGERVRVPNTVVMVWAGELGWFGQRLVAWKSDKLFLEARGFHIVELDYREMTDEEALERIRHYGNQKGEYPSALHGLIVTAHGDPEYFTAKTSDDEARWIITYDELDEALSYGLGMVLINACFSDHGKGDVYRELDHVMFVPVSREGTKKLETAGARDLISGAIGCLFHGVKGILYPVIETGTACSLLKPGCHGTRCEG